MKRAIRKQLRLNVETVRALQPLQQLDDTKLQQVVGGAKSNTGAAGCGRTSYCL